ncbi:MAG: methyltransferase domain-containing protein [Candidatus Gastranaerophilales bacterium]|nr:methyltransferase domain-containing protein [Candidatus Gastranaerophilales bacterium]
MSLKKRFQKYISYKISAYNRQRKWKLFLEFINPKEKDTILDVGFMIKERFDVDNYLERNYPYPENITALGVEDAGEFEIKYPQIKAVKYDGKIFPFSDKSFDICWSNAVIEHVGDRERQILFLKEINRVAKIAYITTPNKYFPVEVHTLTPLMHMLPKNLFDKYLTLTNRKWATGDFMNILSLKDIQEIAKAAGISHCKIIKNKFFGFNLDFIIIFGDALAEFSCLKNIHTESFIVN